MGFEKVLLVMPSGRHGLGYAFDVIPTGLEYLAAFIEDCVSQVHIIDLKMEKKPIDYHLRRLRPDLVGISMCATEHTEGLDIASRAKKLGMTTVVGNFHPTGLASFFASHPDIDFVVRGEGEETLKELIRKGHARDVLGISYKQKKTIVHNPDRPLISYLDKLPFPARHLRRNPYFFPADRKKKLDVLTFSRGCWGRCTFCCEPSMNRGVQRYRSPENIVREIKEVYRMHGENLLSLILTDPCALGSPEIVEEICDHLIPLQLNIEIGCHIRADKVVAYPEVVRKMVRAGFFSFEMGIESPYQRDLVCTKKGYGPDIHEEACRIIREYGAQPLGTFVIGLPEQTEEEILSFPAYGRLIGLSRAAFGIATPFPGTEFYQRLKKENMIFETDWNKFDEMHSVFRTKHLPDKRIEDLFSICMAKFWTLDKLMDIEKLDWKRTGKRKTLFEFGKHLLSLLEVGRQGLIQLHGNHFIQHILAFLKEAGLANPLDYQQNYPIHEIIKMDRFLKILGKQTVQFTICHRSRPLTSWIFQLTHKTVDTIKVIQGEAAGANLHFRFDLSDIENNPNPSLLQLWMMVIRLLNSNRGSVRRINLIRMLTAAALG